MYSIFITLNTFENFSEYNFTIILLNVLIYIIMMLNVFFLFFLFDTKKFKSVNEFKFLHNLQFVSISLTCIFLSLAGIPPFSGFLSKFLIFIHIFYKKSITIFTFFLFINLFSIYFYIQNLRFMNSKKMHNIFIIKNYNAFLNIKTLFNVNILNIFNIASIFYIEEFIIFLTSTSSFLFF